MGHAWCHDIARDEAVRAAEDGRTGPLPTLGESIILAFGFDKASAQRACDEVKSWPDDVQRDCRFVLGDLLEKGVERLQALVEAWRYGKGLLAARYPAMIPKSGSASSAVEQENKGDDMGTNGLRTERVVLEVTHKSPTSAAEFLARRLWWDSNGESVRVVEDVHFDDLAQVAMERDAAIRERDAAVAESERRLRLCQTIKRDGDSSRFHAVVAQARVAELEARNVTPGEGSRAAQAASVGGGLTPHAWGVVLELHDAARAFRDSSIHGHKVRLDKAIAVAERLLTQPRPDVPASGVGEPRAWMCEWTDHTGLYQSKIYAERAADGDVVPQPLYREPPQPRGWFTEEEREAVQWAADAAYDKQHPAEDTLRSVLARSSPPEVVLPFVDPALARMVYGRDSEWLAALAAAGVPVKEVGRG